MTKQEVEPFYVSEFTVSECCDREHILVDGGAETVHIDDLLADADWAIQDLGAGSYVLLVLDQDEWDTLLLRAARDSVEEFLSLEEWDELVMCIEIDGEE